MNEENKIGYYAIIPSTVLFNENLKANEKLLYAVITVLSNKEGYCFASNAYLGNLLKATDHTVSVWVSHLKKMGFLKSEIITDEKGAVIQRRLFPNDTPYVINMTYPPVINKTEGMSQKRQYNNISINKIDRLFNYIINKEQKIPTEFSKVKSQDLFDILKKYEMLYEKELIQYMSDENLERIKCIIYIIALIVKNNMSHLTNKVSRDKLIQIYNDCKSREEEYKKTENRIENFMNYYYKSVENELTREKSPSFFMSENNKKLENNEIGGLEI